MRICDIEQGLHDKKKLYEEVPLEDLIYIINKVKYNIQEKYCNKSAKEEFEKDLLIKTF